MKRSVRLAAWSALLVTAAGTLALGVDYWRDRRVREALFRALDPVLITNCDLRRYGKINDGGYLMCANLMPPAQSAYSYGINGEDSWGCAVSTAANVPVHQYDCFDVRRPHCPTGATTFHLECVEGEKKVIGGRPYDTMVNQIAANGDIGKRLVVKMDVEGSEWTALLAAPDHVLEAIDQMAVEFHEVEDPAYLDTITRLDQFFYIAHVHQNNFECSPGYDPFPGKVFEVLFVNKRIAVANPWQRGRRTSPLDMPNNPAVADCQTSPQVAEPLRIWEWLRRQARELRSAITWEYALQSLARTRELTRVLPRKGANVETRGKKDDTLGEEVSALGQRAKGAAKDLAGDMIDDEEMEREGERENAAGRARQATNNVMDDTDGVSGRTVAPTPGYVTGLYSSPESASRAYEGLTTKHGYKADDINVLMSEDTRKQHFGDVRPGTELSGGTKAAEGLGTGAAIGGGIGAALAAIFAVGSSVVIPGLGLVVAGPIAAALAGAGAGGATGGIIGALIGAGIPEDRAREYERGIKEGGILIGTKYRDADHARQLEQDYTGYGGTNVRY